MDVVAHGFGEHIGGAVVASGLEFVDVGASVILILGLQGGGHVDELDVGGEVEGFEDGVDELQPGVGFAGAEVVESAGVGVVAEKEGHGDGVFDVEKVAHLFAVLVVGMMTFEELDFAVVADLIEGFVDDGAHVAFVVFVGAVDVEVFQSDDVFVDPGALGVEVEEVFGVAIHVEWPEIGDVGNFVIHAMGTVAVGGGGGGVDKAGTGIERPVGEDFGVFEIVLHQVMRVALGGGGVGTEMVNEVEFAEAFRIVDDEFEEVAGVEVVGKFEGDEVLPFFVGAKGVGDEDVFVTLLVESPDEGGADEAGAAGDENAW